MKEIQVFSSVYWLPSMLPRYGLLQIPYMDHTCCNESVALIHKQDTCEVIDQHIQEVQYT